MFLVRKIARAKWDKTRNASRGLADEEISADAVTGDLRTREDTLSFWRCRTEAEGDVEDAVEDAALAIAAAGERLDKLDLVWMADNELQADGHTLKDTEGRTPVAELAKHHVDICQLDYFRLGKVAMRVVAAIEDERCRRLSKAHVKGLLVKAVQQRRVALDKLAEGLRAEVGDDAAGNATTDTPNPIR